MLQRVVGIMRPEAFHGGVFRPPFFEGWYAKLVDRRAEDRLAVIVGLSRGTRDPHAFLQLFDGKREQALQLRFDVADFSASATRMDVRLGACRLTERGLDLAVDRPEATLRGAVRFGAWSRWPVRLWAPGAMGWYAWMPFMECYHGVLSMDHSLQGHLEYDGRHYDFDEGRGYLEKDWGRAFPSSWIWLQSNHFGQPGISLMGSMARIPWIGRSFPGFLVGLLVDGTLHRFAVYTGAKSERLELSAAQLDWVLRDRRYELQICAHRGPSTPLNAPSFEGMQRTVQESLQARLEVQLSRRGWRGGLVYEGSSDLAGLEIHGDPAELDARSS